MGKAFQAYISLSDGGGGGGLGAMGVEHQLTRPHPHLQLHLLP